MMADALGAAMTLAAVLAAPDAAMPVPAAPDAAMPVPAAPDAAMPALAAPGAAMPILAAPDAAMTLLAVLVLGVCAAATRSDVARRVIPNRLTASGALAAIVIGVLLDPSGEPARLAWAVGAGGFLALAAWVSPSGMGLGDAKLAGVIGLCLGGGAAIAVLVALLAGTGYGAIVLVRRGLREARATTLPFAPCLSIGAVAAIAIAVAAGWPVAV